MTFLDEIDDADTHPTIAREQAVKATLAEMKTIATLWTTRDVQFYRPELTDEQAWQVLQECQAKDPGGYRMSFRVINCVANRLFGSKAKSRATKCEKVLRTYEAYPNAPCDQERALVDLLADAMHWCRKNRLDFHKILHDAQRHYYSE